MSMKEMVSSERITHPYPFKTQGIDAHTIVTVERTFSCSRSMGNSDGTHFRQHAMKSDSFICPKDQTIDLHPDST